MDPAQFFTAARVIIVAGKGGVGKTTVTGTLAVAASRVGRNVSIIELEGKSGLPSLFDREELDYSEQVLQEPSPGRGSVTARWLTPDAALAEYLSDHGLQRISRRLAESGAMEMVAAATPGIKDVLVLGKVKQLANLPGSDLILVDAPAAGHAVSFLRSARGLADAVRSGPIHSQATDVLGLLGDGDRCQVILVTLPEETPVNELIETAFSLEDQVGVKLGPIVVNGTYAALPGLSATPTEAVRQAGVTKLPPGDAARLGAAATFRQERASLQSAQRERLSRELPLPQLNLSYRFHPTLGRHDLDALADELFEQLGLAGSDDHASDDHNSGDHNSGGTP